MKKSLLFAITFLVCLSAQSLVAQTEAQLQSVYMTLLKKNNLEGSVDGDGDIVFEREGKSYFFGIDENDPEFFQLVLPNIWPIESELERIQVVSALDKVNRSSKVVKMYQTNSDNVWVCIEMLQGNPEDFEPRLERLFKLIELGVNSFSEHMNE